MTDEAIKQAAEIIFNQREFTEEQKMLQMIAFFSGAKWRIKHVWHDVQKELPAPDKTVIAEYIIDGEKDYCFTHRSESPRVSVDKHGFCFYIRGAEIIRWAYVSDLLPDRKEVQP